MVSQAIKTNDPQVPIPPLYGERNRCLGFSAVSDAIRNGTVVSSLYDIKSKYD